VAAWCIQDPPGCSGRLAGVPRFTVWDGVWDCPTETTGLLLEAGEAVWEGATTGTAMGFPQPVQLVAAARAAEKREARIRVQVATSGVLS
jgi:hypothetical protein